MNKLSNIFLFDVDGTLTINKMIPQSAIDTINYLRSKNNKIMLSTGRCLGQLNAIFNQIDLDGAIINNGSYAYLNDEIIFDCPIGKDIIKRFIEKGYCIGILSKELYAIINYDDESITNFCNYFNMTKPKEIDANYVDNNKIYSLGLYTEKDITDLITEFKELEFIKICPYGYDIVPKGVSKATPFDALRKVYPNSKIISFGDNYNDYEMIKNSDIGIVMQHAPEKLKCIATYVTKEPQDDGIKYAIREILKI